MEISALELRFLAKEFGSLVGSFIKRIYQFESSFVFIIYKPGLGERWLYFDKNVAFLTNHRFEAPQSPPSFCMLLRKYLQEKRIVDIKQHDFDRVLEIHTDENILIIELFGGGNVVLCDKLYNIIMPLKTIIWAAREIKPKRRYQYPPEHPDPFKIDEYLFFDIASKEKSIGAALAVKFGFGPFWSDVICRAVGIDPNKQISIDNAKRILDFLHSLPERPCMYEERVSPFPLPDKKPLEFLSSLSEGLDRLFAKEWEKVEEKKKEKLEVIEKMKEKAIEKWKAVEEAERKKAEAIYLNYDEIKSAIEGILSQRKEGLTWDDIKAKVTKPVKEIREKEGVVVLEIDGRELEIDIRKPIMHIAAEHFEKAKKARKKAEGAVKAEISIKEKKIERPKLKIRRKWWEKFRWFVTSDGILVVAGKDAKQNEELITKRVQHGDLVYHADIPGAAFVILKSSEKGITEISMKEAAEFAAAHSKAWSEGLGSVDVFAVKPEQLSKEPGLPKGAFTVHGSRIWYRDIEVKLAIGVSIAPEPNVLAGPVMAVRKYTKYFVTIKPGTFSAQELAAEIKNRILIKSSPEDKKAIESIPLDEFANKIPSGKGIVIG